MLVTVLQVFVVSCWTMIALGDLLVEKMERAW